MLLNDIHGMKMNVICLFKAKRNWIETERETERERERKRETVSWERHAYIPPTMMSTSAIIYCNEWHFERLDERIFH